MDTNYPTINKKNYLFFKHLLISFKLYTCLNRLSLKLLLIIIIILFVDITINNFLRNL